MNNYLYFPQCKIVKADNVFGYKRCTFAIKSLKITPKHYPEHFMLKGKADFFFKLDYGGIANEVLLSEAFKKIVGKEISLSNVAKTIGKELSVLAYFEPNNEIILECIGIGLPNETPCLFSSGSYEENLAYAKIAVLNSKLAKKKDDEKKRKI